MRASWIRARAFLLLVLLLLAASCSVGIPGRGSQPSPDGTHPPRTLTGTLQGASYITQVPATWNGVLLLYSHGGGALTSSPPAENATDPVTSGYLLRHGYALAGSSFRSSGWFVEDALADDLALLSEFRRRVGRPAHTIAWGVSLGSMVTLGLAERNPDRIDGALAMCGVVADSVSFWNQNIFGRAIGETADYDGDLRRLARGGASPEETLYELAIHDVSTALDVLAEVYQRSDHVDGRVSHEVPASLAYDTEATMAAVRDATVRINKPNLYVKIPATEQGIPAQAAAIARSNARACGRPGLGGDRVRGPG